jgi:hypothetical protein
VKRKIIHPIHHTISKIPLSAYHRHAKMKMGRKKRREGGWEG